MTQPGPCALQVPTPVWNDVHDLRTPIVPTQLGHSINYEPIMTPMSYVNVLVPCRSPYQCGMTWTTCAPHLYQPSLGTCL